MLLIQYRLFTKINNRARDRDSLQFTMKTELFIMI